MSTSTDLFARLLTRRSPWLILGLLLCGLALGSRVEAGTLVPILPNYGYQPKLEFGNANKVAVGRFNLVHAVFAHEDSSNSVADIVYVHYDPLDPFNPNYPLSDYMVSTGATAGVSYQPVLALDNGALANQGMAAVAWVSKPFATDPFGSIYYSFQTQLNCPSCWSTPTRIAYLGAEPSMVAENGTIHLTWTSGDRVQYTSFPRMAPPATPLWLGEVVDFANCPNTRFRQPSIALAYPPCGTLSVKIAALLTANEQSTVGSCQSASTQAGPRVYERDVNTQAWSTVFQDVVSDSTPNQQDPAAVSISLSANRMTGDFYLAWSDELDLSARTRVGHGNGANWNVPQTIDNLRHHVHVKAKSGGSLGHFRLAVSGEGLSTGAYSQTGKWSNGNLTWTSPAATTASSSLQLVGHPQALYWSRCASNQLSEIKVYTEASAWNPPVEVATDFTQTGPVSCRFVLNDAIRLPDCFQTLVLIGRSASGAVMVDLGDTAYVSKLSATGAEITTLAGDTILATWAPGEVRSAWENGFIVATQRDSLRFSSKDAEFTVEDVGGK